MFSFDFMHKQEFPFLCNNQKPSLILNQILKESYRSGLKVWNLGNITRMISLHLDQTPVGKNIWWII